MSCAAPFATHALCAFVRRKKFGAHSLDIENLFNKQCGLMVESWIARDTRESSWYARTFVCLNI